MKKIELLYFLLCYAYAKVYRKVFGNNLGDIETNYRALSFPITWISITLIPPLLGFSNNNKADYKLLDLVITILFIAVIATYTIIQSRKKDKWIAYVAYFDNWLSRYRTIKKISLILLLIAPFLFNLLCFFTKQLITQ